MAEPESAALCSACLVAGRTLSPLIRADHQQYYSHILSEIPGTSTEGEWRVCWECACEVRRSVAFRERAKCSYVLLHRHCDKTAPAHEAELAREPRLRVHAAESVDVAPAGAAAAAAAAGARADADDADACGEERERFEVRLLEESYSIKCEVDAEAAWAAHGGGRSGAPCVKKEEAPSDAEDKSCLFASDDSDDLGRLELAVKAYIRGDTRRRKRKRRGRADKENSRSGEKLVKSVKVKKKKQEPAVVSRRSKKCEEKIRTVELSYEEMLSERARDATRDAYTRADFKCASCLVGFSYRKSYAEHVDTRHDPARGDYSCPICKTVMASVESFTAHYKRHLRRYECGACGKRTMDRKVMTQHYQSTHETGASKEYKCHCGKISHSLDAHRYHKDTHKARVECVECDKTFSHRAGLMNHRLSVHKLNNMFPCTLCEKVFRWKASLKKHLERHERKFRPPPDAPFCEPCGVSFSSVCTYQRHMKNSLKHVTENELKFICNDCNRKFSNKTKLRDHIEEKHLHKTYQCHICSKPSKNRVCLDQHIRNVHKGRPNNKMCHHCGKGFPTKVQLESHIRSHTGERPFICEFCPTTFSQQSNLYKHNRQVHLNIKAKRYPPLCRRRKEKPPAPPPPPPQHPHPPPPHHTTPHRTTDMYHLVM